MSHSRTNTDSFLRALKRQASIQSQLHTNPFIPHSAAPLASIIGLHPWQTLLVSSFISAMIVFLIWFEFFFRFVQNIVS